MSLTFRRLAAAALACAPTPALATAMNRPFKVGGGEGGGAYGGLTGFLLDAQSRLTHAMALDLHAIPHDASALWTLIGVGFVYGIAHAAGPGHGKAVIASYMVANERALRRGLVLALLAALLQGAVAVAIVGVAAIVFHATASRMNAVADGVASLSFLGVAAIGAWLAIKKGFAFAQALRAYSGRRAAVEGGMLFAGAPWRPATAVAGFGGFRAGDSEVIVDDCGHAHAPDPSRLGEGFSWRAGIATVVSAGARPCSGALLVLVFALAQGLFLAGVAATAAMSLGTAVATGTLACLAVYAKRVAIRLAAGPESRAALVARGLECLAGVVVFASGLALYFAMRGSA